MAGRRATAVRFPADVMSHVHLAAVVCRHGRPPCRPSTTWLPEVKAWMAGPSPAMTRKMPVAATDLNRTAVAAAPAIQVFGLASKGVDGGAKPRHDGEECQFQSRG